MKILFIHHNFPGQYKYLAPLLAADSRHTVVALGDQLHVKALARYEGVTVFGYPTPPGASKSSHHYLYNLESSVRRGQMVVRKAWELRQGGFIPDLICCHPGWGDGLFLREIFPDSRLLYFFEFYYHPRGIDLDFDPEYPPSDDDRFRVRIKNAANLLSLDIADAGVTPTHWQWSVHPASYRDRISIIHDGIDTAQVVPNPAATLTLNHTLILNRTDEIITFVNRNLEPYRGYHSFLRALPEIQRRRPKARVLIVGGDELSYGKPLPDGLSYKQKYLNDLSGQLDLSRIHFLGKIPYPHFLALLQLSSVHVYLTYPFVLSWSMLEAMSAGCLVVGSRTTPVEEVITHGHNGLLVDFFKPAEIADAVDEVLNHPDRMQTIRNRARQTIIENYDLHTVCLPQHLALIERVVG